MTVSMGGRSAAGNGQPRRPASHEQERMWFVQQLYETSPLFNIARALEIDGPLDVSALRAALQNIAGHHPILTMALRYSAYGLEQVAVADPTAFDFGSPIDAREWDDDEVQAFLGREAAQTIRLDEAPLARVRLLTRSDSTSLLLLVLHHTVCDALSLTILFEDLARLYAGDGGPSARSATFDEYADWQRKLVGGASLAALRADWRTALAGVPSSLALSGIKQRPQTPAATGAELTVHLGDTSVGKLRTLAAVGGGTLFQAVFSTLARTVSAMTGSSEFILGVTANTRPSNRFARTIGPFVNVLPVPVRLAQSSAPRSDFEASARELRRALARRDVPFDVIVGDCDCHTAWPEPPLVQILVSYEHRPLSRWTMSDLAVRVREVPMGAAQMDLTLYAAEIASGLRVTASYNSEIYEAETIDALLTRWIIDVEDLRV